MTDLYRFLTQMEDSFLGFDRTFRQLESAAGQGSMNREGYPPYNIMKDGEFYRIELAIAGFSEKDIDVNYENGELTISGNKERSDSNGSFLHQGIAYRKFARKFHLAETIEIEGASLIDGILTIYMKNVLPEHLQPKKIEVRKEKPQIGTEQQLLNE